MKRTIHLPDDLAKELETYLQGNPGETWSGFVQKSVRQSLRRKDPSRLLNLVGILPDNAPTDLSTNEYLHH